MGGHDAERMVRMDAASVTLDLHDELMRPIFQITRTLHARRRGLGPDN